MQLRGSMYGKTQQHQLITLLHLLLFTQQEHIYSPPHTPTYTNTHTPTQTLTHLHKHSPTYTHFLSYYWNSLMNTGKLNFCCCWVNSWVICRFHLRASNHWWFGPKVIFLTLLYNCLLLERRWRRRANYFSCTFLRCHLNLAGAYQTMLKRQSESWLPLLLCRSITQHFNPLHAENTGADWSLNRRQWQDVHWT